MKKYLILLLVLSLICTAFAACGDTSGGGSESGSGEGGDAAALDWPKNTIKIIVPYSAGGGADLMARALGAELSDRLSTSVVVENAAGGGGGIGMAQLARAKADGYTLIMATIGAATLTPNSSDVGYTNQEFAPIVQVADPGNVIVVHENSGIASFEELLEKAAQNPGRMTYGTSGAGLTQNVQMEALFIELGQPALLNHIPFDGGSQAVAALLGEQIDVEVSIVSEVLPHVQNGTFKALAITSAERSEELPDVPTLSELGYGIAGGVWYGLAAPAGTDEGILDLIDETVNAILGEPEIEELFANLGNRVDYLGRQAFTEKWMRDFDNNKAILESIGQK